MFTRRNFLKISSLAAAYLTGFAKKVYPDEYSNVFIAESEDIKKAVRHAVDMAGGIARYVKKNDVVALKPNMAWARAPEYAANTNPIVVAEVANLCFKAGAKEVYITDNPCNNPRSVFLLSEIPKHAEKTGAKVFIPQKRDYKEMKIGGQFIKEWDVLEVFKNVDKVINIPVAKQHGSSVLTASMKNWLGAVGGFRGFMHQNLHVAIYELAAFFRPDLNIIDCSRVLLRNGPTGGNLNDVKVLNRIIATEDQAAGDSVAAGYIGFSPESIEYLQIAQRKKFGNISKSAIKIYYEKI